MGEGEGEGEAEWEGELRYLPGECGCCSAHAADRGDAADGDRSSATGLNRRSTDAVEQCSTDGGTRGSGDRQSPKRGECRSTLDEMSDDGLTVLAAVVSI